MEDLIKCQECGMMVKPKEFHSFEYCERFKVAKKLVNLSEFQENLKQKIKGEKE